METEMELDRVGCVPFSFDFLPVPVSACVYRAKDLKFNDRTLRSLELSVLKEAFRGVLSTST
jgi:hypothetical protein